MLTYCVYIIFKNKKIVIKCGKFFIDPFTIFSFTEQNIFYIVLYFFKHLTIYLL